LETKRIFGRTMAALTEAPQLEAGETILFTQPSVVLARSGLETEGDEEREAIRDKGTGTLCITSSRILHYSPDGVFEFQSTSLAMHAISREGNEEFPRPSLYCQLEESHGLPAEVFFAPTDASALEACFRAFAQTALLNPPPDDDEEGGLMSGEGFDGDGFYGEVDDELITGGGGGGDDDEREPSEEARAAMLAHLDSILQVPPSLVVHEIQAQFEDSCPPAEPRSSADGP
jgi:hypothetical protein